MGAAGAAEADVPRRPPGSQDWQGLLRVRRQREEEDIDDLRTDTAKAAAWGALSGFANVGALAFAPGFFPDWYFLLIAVGYGLLLPVIAVLHVRHAAARESGAVLATVAGTATVTIGIAASASSGIVVAALLVRGIWWWTAGKMWAETGVMPRWLGTVTMVLAALTLAGAVASAPMALSTETMWLLERLLLALWTLVLSFALWRTR